MLIFVVPVQALLRTAVVALAILGSIEVIEGVRYRVRCRFVYGVPGLGSWSPWTTFGQASDVDMSVSIFVFQFAVTCYGFCRHVLGALAGVVTNNCIPQHGTAISTTIA